MADDAVGICWRRDDVAEIGLADFVGATGGEQEAADVKQRGDGEGHFLEHFAASGLFRRFAVVAQAGGQFDQHRIDAGGERGQAVLLDQNDDVTIGIIGQHRCGATTAPEFPGAQAGLGAVEPAMAEAHDIERKAAVPDALLGFDVGPGLWADQWM